MSIEFFRRLKEAEAKIRELTARIEQLEAKPAVPVARPVGRPKKDA